MRLHPVILVAFAALACAPQTGARAPTDDEQSEAPGTSMPATLVDAVPPAPPPPPRFGRE